MKQGLFFVLLEIHQWLIRGIIQSNYSVDLVNSLEFFDKCYTCLTRADFGCPYTGRMSYLLDRAGIS